MSGPPWRSQLGVILISGAIAGMFLAFVASASRKTGNDTGVRLVTADKQNANDNGKDLKPLAVNITATLADDITLAQKKNPLTGAPSTNNTITYTAVITNSGGTDASGVVYNDTLDANTTQLGGVVISPLAINESYQSIGQMTFTSANLGANCGAN